MIETDAARGGSVHHPPQHRSSQHRRQRGPSAQVEFTRVRRRADVRGNPFAGQPAKPAPGLAREIGLVREDVSDGRIEPGLEERHEFGPDAVPRNGHVVVRLVVNEGDRQGSEIVPKLGAPAGQERTDKDAAAGMHPGESARSGTAHKAEQNGLRLVVAGVAERDEIRAEMPPGALEEIVAGGARRRLNRLPIRCGTGGDIGAIGEDRHAELRGEGGGVLLVTVGRRAELMVEVGEPGHAQLAARLEIEKQAGQGDGIGPARNGGHDPVLREQEIVFADKTADTIEQAEWAGEGGWARNVAGWRRTRPGALPAHLAHPAHPTGLTGAGGRT